MSESRGPNSESRRGFPGVSRDIHGDIGHGARRARVDYLRSGRGFGSIFRGFKISARSGAGVPPVPVRALVRVIATPAS